MMNLTKLYEVIEKFNIELRILIYNAPINQDTSMNTGCNICTLNILSNYLIVDDDSLMDALNCHYVHIDIICTG